ncbi:ABC transporter substrate-binding protein [Mesorhizobium sp.]|uniref:substrate-binding periplasmic protein n=1 Tax=Mesorhizobium sp. TaxID=1871066 RepID=UPI0025E73887|nr:transporter substrate-binding domain-containing protein [Mesorhizobium sp.]
MKILSFVTATVIVSFSALTAAAAADCKPAHQFPTVTSGTLTVAAYELPPFSSVKNGEFNGIDPDIVREIVGMECLKVEVISLDPAAAIQAVLSGKADLTVGNWYRTAARAKVLSLSAPLYLDQMGVISKEGATKVSQLSGKKVGNIQGYLWYNDIAKLFGDSAITYPNSVNMAQDLAAGRIDAGFESYVVGKEAQKNGAYGGMKVEIIEPDDSVAASKEPAQSNFPHTKDNPKLTDALKDDINALHANGKIGEILKKYGLDPSGANTGEPRVIQ